MGLCPLHADHKPSFLVDPHKDLFYCYGCGRGGDVIRFAELYHHVRFSEALALLRQWRGAGPLLDEAARFCRRYDPPGGAAGDHHRLVPSLSADPPIERSFCPDVIVLGPSDMTPFFDFGSILGPLLGRIFTGKRELRPNFCGEGGEQRQADDV